MCGTVVSGEGHGQDERFFKENIEKWTRGRDRGSKRDLHLLYNK